MSLPYFVEAIVHLFRKNIHINWGYVLPGLFAVSMTYLLMAWAINLPQCTYDAQGQMQQSACTNDK
jgi:hypothetical protein